MQENRVEELEIQKQLMKYAEDLAKLNHALKKEKEHSLKSKTKAVKAPDKSGTQNQLIQNEKMAVVEVEDTGMGIPEDQLPNVFEPFFTTKEAEKGTGLGLSLAHLIIDRHRGNIHVQSEVDKGTKFTLNLQPASN